MGARAGQDPFCMLVHNPTDTTGNKWQGVMWGLRGGIRAAEQDVKSHTGCISTSSLTYMA
jgi:hypothetical protein